jgi:hypothetical protein
MEAALEEQHVTANSSAPKQTAARDSQAYPPMPTVKALSFQFLPSIIGISLPI